MSTRWSKRLARTTKNAPRYRRDGGGLAQTYGTPWYIVRALERELGRPFDLDCCAEKWSAKAPRFYTKRDDGLVQPWAPLTWCNPPWAIQGVWLARAAEIAERQRITVCCLVLASTSAQYWRPTVFERATCDFFENRIDFLDPKTRQPTPGFDRANALVIYGPGAVPGLVRVRSAKTGELISIVEARAERRRRRAA